MTTAAASQVRVSPKTQAFIDEIKVLWLDVGPNYMKMGEYFSQLRAETEKYRRSYSTGITYASAVRRTGVPRSTAEFYRSLYDTAKALEIKSETFIAFHDSGVNLASSKYYDKESNELRFIDVSEIRNLDATDGEAVSRVVEKLKAEAANERPGKTAKDLDRVIRQAAAIAAVLNDRDWSKAKKEWDAVLDYLVEHGILERDPAPSNDSD